MADTLKLDVFVDEHGAVQTLKNVDDGVNKVKSSAAQTGLSTAQLNAQFDALRGRTDVLAARSLPAMGAGLVSVAALGGVAIGAFTLFAATVREAAADAEKFTDAADALQAPVTRIQQITTAAAESKVGFDAMVGGLTRLQERIGKGGLNADLEKLGINLHAFREADIVEQFLQIADAIAGIDDPAERAAMRVKVLGGNSEEMARLMKKSFREATDDVTGMSAASIAALDEMKTEWDGLTRTVSNFSREAAIAMAFFLTGRDPESGGPDAHDFLFGVNPGTPTLPSGPGVPGLGPVRPPDALGIDLIDQNIRASIAINQLADAHKEANFAMDEYLRKIGQVVTFVPEFMALYDAQKLLAKGGLDWADTLNKNVGAAVDLVTGKLVKAMEINIMLSGEAGGRRDTLMEQLTQTSNPNESDADRRFNAIDARYKKLMAMVDQTDRATAAGAENAILEATNLEVMQLQQGVGAGGGRLASVTNQTTIDARGALFDSPGSMDQFVRRIETLLAERSVAGGGKVSR